MQYNQLRVGTYEVIFLSHTCCICFKPYSDMPNLCCCCWYKGNYNRHMSWRFCSDKIQWNLLRLTAASCLNQPTFQRPTLSPLRFWPHCQPQNTSLQLQWQLRNFQPNAQNSYTLKFHNYTTIMMQVLWVWFPRPQKEAMHGTYPLFSNLREAEPSWKAETLFIYLFILGTCYGPDFRSMPCWIFSVKNT